MKKILVLILAATAFLICYGGGETKAYPGGGIYGRAEYRGYFTNTFDTNGTFVMFPSYSGQAFPAWVNSADPFIFFVESQLSGNNQQRTGAAFIIQTMIGSSRNRPPTAGEIAEWENRVRAAQAQGRTNFFFNYSYNINSYFQGSNGGGGTNDDAFYDDVGSSPAIIFFNPDGTHYAIRRQCANPVGVPSPLPVGSNYNVGSWVTLDNSTPRPGDTINFRYFVQNNGPTSTNPTHIWWVAIDTVTPATVGGPADSGIYAGPEQKNVFNEAYTVPAGTAAGTQICRQIGWDPVDSAGNRNGRSAVVCATVRYDYTLTPSINIEVNDGATPGAVAEPGDKVEFIYAVTNSGTTESQMTNCNIYGLARNGFYAVPTPNDTTSDAGFVQPAHGCPRVFPWSATPAATTMVTETIASIPAADANKSICRTLSINPRSATSATPITTEVCVRVAAKPYFRVYGGDVSAGGGQTTTPGTCVSNANAAIIGWNQGASGGYGAAGVQYAAMALNRIYDVATSLNNGGGAAPTPSGLAFSNTGASGSNFGGTFGSLPCISNYYNITGAAPLTTSNLTSLSGIGRYAGTGPRTLGGNINPSQRTVVYVQGDVLINSNIAYTGSWSPTTVPLFQLVVLGDIYISQNVTQLDGIYIAQPNGATGGNIHTCANPALPATPVPTTGGSVYTNCRNKLTINGAFVAKRVGFLRTNGSLKQAAPGEGSASANIAEVFNFSPALWMVQPPTPSGSGGEYDAITGLPPVL